MLSHNPPEPFFMLKPLLLAFAMLPLVACTTHDRVFYNNRPHKGHGLIRPAPAAAELPPATDSPGSSTVPVVPVVPGVSDPGAAEALPGQ